MRFRGRDLLGDAAPRQPARIPARHQRQTVPGEHFAQRRRLARELVAELEALVADRAAFRQRDLERGLAAERGQVVVAPRDGVDADPDVEGARSSPRPLQVFLVAPAGGTNLLAFRDLGHRDVPPAAALDGRARADRSRWQRHTSARAARARRSAASSSAMVFDVLADRAERLGVRRVVDRRRARRRLPQSASRLLNDAPPQARCRR